MSVSLRWWCVNVPLTGRLREQLPARPLHVRARRVRNNRSPDLRDRTCEHRPGMQASLAPEESH